MFIKNMEKWLLGANMKIKLKYTKTKRIKILIKDDDPRWWYKDKNVSPKIRKIRSNNVEYIKENKGEK